MDTNQQQHRMRVTAPDSITSWLTNMACVSNSGLGVSPTAKLVVFQPFFLKLAMPYSAVRGETSTAACVSTQLLISLLPGAKCATRFIVTLMMSKISFV